MSDSLWDSPDSGLKEDFDGTITFETRWNQFEGGNFTLDLKIQADDGDTVFVRGLGAGKNWTSYDGGESIQGPTSKAKFHAKTGMWKWIAAATKAGAGDYLRAKDAELGGGNGRTFAKVWDGLRFHFDVVDEQGTKRDDDGNFRDATVQVIRPTAFLGNGDAPATSNGNSTTPASIASVLREVAQKATSYKEFGDLAMEALEKLPADQRKAGYIQIADEAYYESLKA